MHCSASCCPCPATTLTSTLPSLPHITRQVLLAGLSAAQHSSESVRELAFLLVRALAQHHASLFVPLLDVVLQPLLQGCADSSHEVRALCAGR